MSGTGLLSYIRPVGEEALSSGLDELRAYRPDQAIDLEQSLGFAGFQYAGLTCFVITDSKSSQSLARGLLLGFSALFFLHARGVGL